MQILSGKTLIEKYNEIFTENYDKLKRIAQQDDDVLHHVYIKNLNRFDTNDFFSAHTSIETKLLNFMSLSIHNHSKTMAKQTGKHIEINDDAENKLVLNDLIEKHDLQHYQELQYLTEKLFEYTGKHYNEAENYTFRVYYLWDVNNKKITYTKLSEITGYSVSKVCGIITKIKKDLRQNLINYINDNQRTDTTGSC
jgi:hypothetical protein